MHQSREKSVKARLSSHDSATNSESAQAKRSPLKNGNRQGDYNNAPRCGAKTRAGTPCKRAALRNAKGIHTRCPLHGGLSTGAKTTEGRERIGKANLKHGRYSKATLESKKWFRAIREFSDYLDDYEGRLLLNVIMWHCGNEIVRCVTTGADEELAKYCNGVLEASRTLMEPIAKVAPFIGMNPWKPDQSARRYLRALEAGAAGLGCREYARLCSKRLLEHPSTGCYT